MKIAIDARFWGVRHTGLGRYTENLVRHLVQIDAQNEYLLFDDASSETDFSWLPANFTIQKLSSPHHTMREQWELWRAVQTSQADLIHFPHYIVPLLPFKIPFIVTVHDLIKLKYSGSDSTTLPLPMYYLKTWFFRWSMQKGVKQSIYVITDTEAVRQEMINRFNVNTDKVRAIPLGVSREFGGIGDDILRTLPSGLIKNKYLLFVGNAYPYKNVEGILQALSLLPPDINLVLVGSRDVFKDRLMSQITSLHLMDRVKFLGYVDDTNLSVLYQNALAFVSLSKEEGFGLQSLEAMVNSCPVILSDIPVFKEICGEAALYVDKVDDGQELSEVVERLAQDESSRQSLIEKGQERVKIYSWEKTAQQTLKVYEDSYRS